MKILDFNGIIFHQDEETGVFSSTEIRMDLSNYINLIMEINDIDKIRLERVE